MTAAHPAPRFRGRGSATPAVPTTVDVAGHWFVTGEVRLMATVTRWSGREARALREAKRMSVRAYAAHLGITVAAVANWERRGTKARLRHLTQQMLDIDLAQAPAEVKERFHRIVSGDGDPVESRSLGTAPPAHAPSPADGGDRTADGADALGPDDEVLAHLVRLAGAASFGALADLAPDLFRRATAASTLPKRVEQPHVDQLRDTCLEFERWDQVFGGVLPRQAMDGHLRWAVDVLRTSSMADDVRSRWASTAARLADVAGWACFDAGDGAAARYHFLVAVQLATQADDVQQRTHVLTSMARQAVHEDRPQQAADLVDLARLSRRSLPRVALAVLHIVDARVQARSGEPRACMAAVARYEQTFRGSGGSAGPTWAYYDEAQMVGDASHAVFDLAMRTGDPVHADEAQARLRAAYNLHDAAAGRSRALNMAKLACLAGRFADPVTACELAEQAMADAATVSSERVLGDLRALEGIMGRERYRGSVRERVAGVRARLNALPGRL